MQNPPDIAMITAKLMEILNDTVESKEPFNSDRPLMKEQGLDSLDMIEFSFAIEEHFGFQFSDSNFLDELEKQVGHGKIVNEGVVTDLGLDIAKRRMPILNDIELDDRLTPPALINYYTLQTFAAIIMDFYVAIPDVCPKTGEKTILDGLNPVAEKSRTPVEAPNGDDLVEQWANETAKGLRA